MKIDMEFARRDDCFDHMVPSDLRALVGERDALAAELQALRGQVPAVVGATLAYCCSLLDQGVDPRRVEVPQMLKDITDCMANITTSLDQPGQAQAKCGCKPFCEHHGRDEIEADAGTGEEFCNECAADGWSGELCWPSAKSCFPDDQKANEWERSFMCPEHAAEHVIFCAEDEDGNDDDDAPADQQEGGQENSNV